MTGRPADVGEVIEVGVAIAERLRGLLAGAAFEDAEHQQVAARLCLTIADGFGGVLALFESPAQTQSPILARSMLEALVDLKNLVADPAYLDQMRFDNADQQLKTFAGFRDDPDVGMDEEELHRLQRWVATEQQIHDETNTRERRDFNICKKFERAGMLDTYLTAYRFLCSSSHNDLATLRVRHGTGAGPRLGRPLPAETATSILGIAANIYAQAIRTTPSYSTISEADAVAAADWVVTVIGRDAAVG